jgi:hypothetical protein
LPERMIITKNNTTIISCFAFISIPPSLFLLLKLQFNESQVSEVKRAETCWTNYPRSEATWDYPMCEFKCYYSLLRNLFPKLALAQYP